jgi:hypothetical protein
MKNLVYMQLIREGFKVYAGKTDQLEIDFVGQHLQDYGLGTTTEGIIVVHLRDFLLRELSG